MGYGKNEYTYDSENYRNGYAWILHRRFRRCKILDSVLNEFKNRGLKNILIMCADGLKGLKEAIAAVYPKTEFQRCMVQYDKKYIKICII